MKAVNNRSDSNMKTLSYIVMCAALVFLGFTIGRVTTMGQEVKPAISTEIKHTLTPYTGVGSGVYKHGTIVKVINGNPVVVGHFDDDSGAEYPGTVEIKAVQ